MAMDVGTDPADWNRVAADNTMSYIQSNYPYWNRTGGSDHMWIVTQDHGCVTISMSACRACVSLGASGTLISAKVTAVRGIMCLVQD